MKFFKISIIITLGFTFFSCNSEKLVENTQDSWKLLIAKNNPTPTLTLYEYPSGKVLSQDVYVENNGTSLTSAPDKLAEYSNMIFLFFSEEKKIVIINQQSFKKLSEIDFSSLNRTPLSICFANGTTAYLIYKNDSIVDVFDLTVLRVTSTINIGKTTTAISCFANKVVVANGPDNMITVLDTRDNSIRGSIAVEPYPCLVDFSADGLKAIVISSGYGKFDSTAKSNAIAQTIDYELLQPLQKADLGVGVVRPIEQIPQSMAANAKVYCFVGTKEYLLRYITRTGTQVTRIDNGNYLSVIYNFKRDEMIFVKQSGVNMQLITADPVSASVKANYTLPSGYICLLPI